MAERELLVDGMQALLPGLDLLEFGAEIRELLLDRELLLISSQIDDFILVVAFISRSSWWYLNRLGRCEMVMRVMPMSLACAYIKPSTSVETADVHSSNTAKDGWW